MKTSEREWLSKLHVIEGFEDGIQNKKELYVVKD